jgi:hypothetical protein
MCRQHRKASQTFLPPMNADQKFWTIGAAFLSAFIGVKIPCGVAPA